jgi:hypothetical protein
LIYEHVVVVLKVEVLQDVFDASVDLEFKLHLWNKCWSCGGVAGLGTRLSRIQGRKRIDIEMSWDKLAVDDSVLLLQGSRE